MNEPLWEKHRPRSWEQVVGQDAAIATLNLIRRRSGSLAGRAYWISGSSGTGKTTIARLIAGEIADEWTVEEVDASRLTANDVADIERRIAPRTLGRGGHCVIINESHGLRSGAIRQLLVAMERIPKHVAWIFTTTSEGQESLFADELDASPLLSRCTVLALSRRGLAEAFASRVQEIAESEGLGGADAAKYLRLAKDSRNNFRAMLGAVETGAMMLGAAEIEKPRKTAKQ